MREGETELRRHAQRRRAGVPVLSILRGPAARAEALWRASFPGAQVRALDPWAREPAAELARIARGLLEPEAAPAGPAPVDLRTRAARYVMARAGLSSARVVRDATEYERGVLARQLMHDPKALAGLEVAAGASVPLDSLLPFLEHPMLFVPAEAEPFAFCDALQQMAPRWPEAQLGVVWCGGLDSWSALLGPGRARWRDGLIELGGATPAPALLGVGEERPAYQTSVDQVIDRSAAWQQLRKAIDTKDEPFARSAAERLLFECLEAHGPTRGRFRLNALQPFHFGPKRCEVDLFADGARIALEVDGYFHFTGGEPYRRDRRKDLLLQRHGLCVMRVLATDVYDDVVSIVETAAALVTEREESLP